MNHVGHGEVRVVPLGGLGEIGMNCLALEDDSQILVIDCGITFPHHDLGVDTFRPDFGYLEKHRERVRGVFLTHGHEDHVGALGYLLSRIRVPVWGPPHALAVAERRLSERDVDPARTVLIPTQVRTHYQVGPFDVEPIRVAHSIVDATALAIRTSAGTLVHTGDFNFDADPPDGEPTDEERLREIGDAGVRLLLSDSTNIDGRSEPLGEKSVGAALSEIVERATGRVVIGMFASNVQRLSLVGDIAQRTGRKIVLFGRSMQQHVAWARELGRLDWPSNLLVAPEDAKDLLPHRALLLAGGTQAEPRSALFRLAEGTHSHARVEAGDTVVLSSRVIPGNDRPVFDLMANFLRRGVLLRSWITDPRVHTSGHASRSEQERMLDLVRPRGFIPLHGTLHHLMRHADLARTRGVPEVLVIENGEVARMTGDDLTKDGRVEAGKIATWDGKDISDAVLRERAALGRAGMVHVTIIVDEKGRLAEPPSVTAHGVLDGEQLDGLLRATARQVAEALEDRAFKSTLADVARTAARRAVFERTGAKPIGLVTVIRR